MKRIVWLSNVDLTEKQLNKSGTWIHSMFRSLKTSKDIYVCANITFTLKSYFFCKDVEGVNHYYIPISQQKKNGYPTAQAIEYVINVIKKENPSLLHIWGMEMFWGLITKDIRLLKFPKLLEIQGIKSVCALHQWMYGGLPKTELRKMRSFAQWLLPMYRVENVQKKFSQWKNAEEEILTSMKHINTQSEWVRNIIPSMNSNAILHKTGIILRPVFMNSAPWSKVHENNENPVIFTITSDTPYKGLHITLDAFKLVKGTYPKAKLIVAGINKWTPSFIRGGYEKYIYYKIKELDLVDSVELLGNVDENVLLENMYKADVFINSSFVETYCLALAEALALGVPSVVSYSSALSELIVEGQTGLLYPVGDFFVCASKILQLLSDNELCKEISVNSSNWYRKEKNEGEIVKKQINTYLNIISES